jgi:hypothetical protein
MTEQDQTEALVPIETIAGAIREVRGQRVILDSDLARLYDVETRTFNQAVRRNLDRFPPDFMFQLTEQEAKSLRSQIVTSNAGRGGRRYRPYAFTEHGAAMAATILKTPRAVQVSVYVVRAFIHLRGLLATHAELSQRLTELDARLSTRLDDHDEQIAVLLEAIRQLMLPPGEDSKRRIGFRQGQDSCPG